METRLTMEQVIQERESKMEELTSYVVTKLESIKRARYLTSDTMMGKETEESRDISAYSMDTEDTLMAVYSELTSSYFRLLEVDNVRAYVKTLASKRAINIGQKRDSFVCLNPSENTVDNESNKNPSDFHVSLGFTDSRIGRYDTLKAILKGIAFTSKGKPRKGISRKHLAVTSKVYLSGKTQREVAMELNLTEFQVSRIRSKIDSIIVNLPLQDTKSRYYSGQGGNYQNSVTPSIFMPIQNETPGDVSHIPIADYVPIIDVRPDRHLFPYALMPVNTPIPARQAKPFPNKGRNLPYKGFRYINGKIDIQPEIRTIGNIDYIVNVPLDGSGNYDKTALLSSIPEFAPAMPIDGYRQVWSKADPMPTEEVSLTDCLALLARNTL